MTETKIDTKKSEVKIIDITPDPVFLALLFGHRLEEAVAHKDKKTKAESASEVK